MERSVKTFAEFTGSGNTSNNESAYEGKSCMSEATSKKLNEMVEAMCKEMKACHDDESENTAESYMKECEGMMTKMKESLTEACNECMK
jgi:hypothetical protein